MTPFEFKQAAIKDGWKPCANDSAFLHKTAPSGAVFRLELSNSYWRILRRVERTGKEAGRVDWVPLKGQAYRVTERVPRIVHRGTFYITGPNGALMTGKVSAGAVRFYLRERETTGRTLQGFTVFNSADRDGSDGLPAAEWLEDNREEVEGRASL